MKEANGRYVEVDGKPVLEPDLYRWGAWMETSEKRVDCSQLGEVEISTVFLGLDHNMGGSGSPILYETMVFGGSLDGEQERYETRVEAVKGHALMLERVRKENT